MGFWIDGESFLCSIWVLTLSATNKIVIWFFYGTAVELLVMGNQTRDSLKLERNSYLWFILGVYFGHLYLTIVYFCQAYLSGIKARKWRYQHKPAFSALLQLLVICFIKDWDSRRPVYSTSFRQEFHHVSRAPFIAFKSPNNCFYPVYFS